MTNKPKFIVIDGPDGSGKTTICNHLKSLFEQDERKVIILKGLGSGKLGEIIRQEFFDKNLSETEVVLGIALALAETNKLVQKYLDEGYNVICDRYIGSYYVYQIKTFNLPNTHVIFDDILLNLIQPDIYITTNCDYKESKERLRYRKEKNNWIDNLEKEKYDSVNYYYYKFYREVINKIDSDNNIILDCDKSLLEVLKEIDDIYKNHLNLSLTSLESIKQ